MKVLVCCCLLSVLTLHRSQAVSRDYPGLVSWYEDNDPVEGLTFNRRSWPESSFQSNSLSEIPLLNKRYGYKRNSLNDLIQRLLALRGDSPIRGRARIMRFGAGRRR